MIFGNQLLSFNWKYLEKEISVERLKNISLESILNKNKELISKLDDLFRKISSLEKTISVANQCATEENSLFTKGIGG